MSTREADQRGGAGARSFLAPVPAFVDEHAESEDKVLTLAFKSGDKGAYQAIHDRYATRVHGVCRRMLLHPEDAEEAAQESFLRVYQALGRFNGRYLLGPWITRITTNVCLDHLRAKGRRPVDLMPVEILDVHAHCDPDIDPQEMHVRRAESRRVHKMLESLPPMYRAAIVLRDFEGLSYAEIATALEITDTQVKALIHRARQAFKRSWSSALLALPLRFLNRVRRLETSAREQGNQAATSVQHTSEFVGSAAQAAQSCSTLVQQCGNFLADKAAVVATAVVVSTGAVASASAPAQPPRQQPVEILTETTADEPLDRLVSATSKRAPDHGASKDTVADGEPESDEPAAPAAEPTPPAEEPAEAPVPVETNAPSEQPPPPSNGAGGGDAEPTPAESPPPPPPPVPAGFEMSFAVQGPNPSSTCTCTAPTKVAKSDVGVTSAGIARVDQVLTGSASSGGAPTYGLWVDHQSSSGTDHSMDFRLYTNEGGYFYSASGTLVDRALMAWNGWQYTYRGTYRVTSRPGGAEPLTSSGSYTVVVSASWEENRVVSTHFTVVHGN
ncbi:MAG TPA: RNA polymerase sigma factor [Actinomycetota bacterium]|jgi:RNA polymerase sigma-70 factor (ECF subfamily)